MKKSYNNHRPPSKKGILRTTCNCTQSNCGSIVKRLSFQWWIHKTSTISYFFVLTLQKKEGMQIHEEIICNANRLDVTKGDWEEDWNSCVTVQYCETKHHRIHIKCLIGCEQGYILCLEQFGALSDVWLSRTFVITALPVIRADCTIFLTITGVRPDGL